MWLGQLNEVRKFSCYCFLSKIMILPDLICLCLNFYLSNYTKKIRNFSIKKFFHVKNPQYKVWRISAASIQVLYRKYKYYIENCILRKTMNVNLLIDIFHLNICCFTLQIPVHPIQTHARIIITPFSLFL